MLLWRTAALISLVGEVFQHCDSGVRAAIAPSPPRTASVPSAGCCGPFAYRWDASSSCCWDPCSVSTGGQWLGVPASSLPKAGAVQLPAASPELCRPCHIWLPLQAASCRERCCLCPGHGRDRGTVQSFFPRAGSFFPAFASFPGLSPRLSSPLAAAMVPVCSSPLISQPPGSPGTGHAGPAPLFPSSCLPQQSQHPCSRRGCALRPAGEPFPQLYPSVWARGRQSVSAAPCRQEGSRSFPLCLPTVQLRCPKMRLSGWDAMGGGCPFHGMLVGKETSAAGVGQSKCQSRVLSLPPRSVMMGSP